MNNGTLTQIHALWHSIEHYHEDIYPDPARAEEYGLHLSNYCACCSAYLFSAVPCSEKCEGCPIADAVGYTSCLGTPWDTMADLLSDDPHSPEAREAILEEIAFLVDVCFALIDTLEDAA